jgi:hypothetical protein
VVGNDNFPVLEQPDFSKNHFLKTKSSLKTFIYQRYPGGDWKVAFFDWKVISLRLPFIVKYPLI